MEINFRGRVRDNLTRSYMKRPKYVLKLFRLNHAIARAEDVLRKARPARNYTTDAIAMTSLRNGRSPSTLASSSMAARWPS